MVVATTLLATTLPVALSVVATRLAPFTLPAVDIFPPVILPLTLIVVPVKLALLIMVVAETLLAITLPATLANPPVIKLLPVTFPVADTRPVTNNPLEAKTAKLAVPATLTATLLLL